MHGVHTEIATYVPVSQEVQLKSYRLRFEGARQSTTFAKFKRLVGLPLWGGQFVLAVPSKINLPQELADTLVKKLSEPYIDDAKNSSSIIELITSLGMQSLLEGIETQEQAEAAKSAGIDLHQGYFYGRPQPMSGFD